MAALTFILLFFTDLSVEIRIVIILAIFLSLAAFLMSLFSVFLFYKFYRDTIKPIPLLLFDRSKSSMSLRLLNNGHSAFYIRKFFISKGNKIFENILSCLPALSDEALYSLFSATIQGRKVMPDQSILIFELESSTLSSYISKEEAKNLMNSLNDTVVEIHCHDIGKRYETIVRKSISFDSNRD